LTFDTDAFLATKNGGAGWTTLGPGLKRTDLRHVYAMPTGWWASLNNGGLMKYDETLNKWVKAGLFTPETATAAVAQTTKGKKTAAARKPLPKKAVPQQLAFQVHELTYGGSKWFAATTGGVLVSTDKGATWKLAAPETLVKSPAQSLEASNDGSQVWAVSQKNLLYSADGGAHWEAKELSFASAGNLRLRRMDDDNLFITTNMGLYISRDAGRNWNRADLRDLQFQDAAGAGSARLVALQRRGLVASFDNGKTWQRVSDPLAEGYFPLVRANNSGSLLAVSATEGLFTLEAGSRSASEAVGGSSLMMLDANSVQKPR
ncbi:MAG TPA: YCF48-related protein, partial [Candidatus Acidoferrum sp.]|nr:YCF48-related protein [Candidatus Acidoferrum sp.]